MARNQQKTMLFPPHPPPKRWGDENSNSFSATPLSLHEKNVATNEK